MKIIKIGLMLFLINATTLLAQQDIIGKWKTIDDVTGEPRSIIEIYQKGNKYYGKIAKVLDESEDAQNCSRCDSKYRNRPMTGVVIMSDLVEDGNEYEDGTIIDPENGKTYRCKIWVDEENPNILNVRGYIAFLFRTQQWIKA